MTDKPMVIVSKSEPDDAIDRLIAYGLNAIYGEAGTDYVWYPHGRQYGIERKTVTNLLQSLKDRQLVQQAHRGVEQFDRYFILIEGDYREGSTGAFEFHSPRHPESDVQGWVTSGWRWDAIEGMLLDLSLLGAFYVRCKMFDYARKVSMVVNSTSASHKAFIRERERPQLPPSAALGGELYSDAIWALCALDGCGPKVAEALMAEYGSLAKAIEAIADGRIGDVKTRGEKPRKLGPMLAKKLQAAVL